ncbi:MAG TPA: hypothetical protein P5132_02055 [Bacteroidales bacterium]|nr:hypothetical protein [Bacteroidales bacterium]
MSKILRIALILLLVISALLTILFYGGGEDASGNPLYTNAFLVWAAILAVIAVVFTILLPIFQMVTNFKKAKKGLLGVIALVVVLAIAYFMASDELLGITNPDLVKYDVPSTLKYAGTMINSIYVLAIIAIGTMIYTEVAKMFK